MFVGFLDANAGFMSFRFASQVFAAVWSSRFELTVLLGLLEGGGAFSGCKV